ncbi:MAG: HAMP domain-containing histidine kinase [Actinomycetota bacterium]|nr:HAMP domain-containing histidine kinase [Actinomycetota bacterium]
MRLPAVRSLPLHTQLLALLLLTAALVVLATSLAGTVALRSYLLDRVDANLALSARTAGERPADVGRALDDADPDRNSRRGGRGGPGPRGGGVTPVDFYTAQYDSAGTKVSDRLGDVRGQAAPPQLPPLDAERARRLAGRAFTVPATDGSTDWRTRVVALPDGESLVLALPLRGVEETVGRLLAIDALVGLAALALAAGLAWYLVRRSLRPLVEVETTAHAIAEGDLSRRVPVLDPRTEVGSLSASFNRMVDRFQTAYEAQQRSEEQARASEDRMRRFVGDASHELRTPLTSIRGFAELYRQGAVGGGADLDRVMQRIEGEAARMGLLVEDLLLLARLDQQRPLQREPVDLRAVAADAVHDVRGVAPDHVVRLEESPDVPPVTGDEARLRQVVGNLVGNAVAHTPRGTTVDVRVAAEDGEVRVDVRDDGPGMLPEVAARVFERFYRADSSRTRTGAATTGSGLGLSIVAALVAAHGGRVEVDSAVGHGTTFAVRLPAAPPDDPDASEAVRTVSR